MNGAMQWVLAAAVVGGIVGPLQAAQWYVAPNGTAEGAGTEAAPWDLGSALAGERPVAPGDVIWIAGGTYEHPDRSRGSPGYVVRLAGQEGKPIHVRAVPVEGEFAAFVLLKGPSE